MEHASIARLHNCLTTINPANIDKQRCIDMQTYDGETGEHVPDVGSSFLLTAFMVNHYFCDPHRLLRNQENTEVH